MAGADSPDGHVGRFFELSNDLLCIVGFDGSLRRVNPALERALGRTEAELRQESLFDYVHPDERAALVDRLRGIEHAQAIEGLEIRCRHADGGWHWINWSAQPDHAGGEIYSVGRDITASKRAEALARESQERKSFVLRLSDVLRPLSDAAAIQATVTRTVMEYFGSDRCYYCEIDGDVVTIRRDAARVDLPSVAATYALNEMPIFRAVVEQSQPIVVADVRTTDSVDEALRQLCIQTGVISFLDVPLVKNGRPAGLLCITQSTPRTWTDAEVDLAVEVAERTWTTVERGRVEAVLRESEARLAADLIRMRRLYDLHSALANETDLYVALGEILAAAVEFTGTDRGTVQLVSEDGERLEIVAHHGYGTGTAFTEHFLKTGSGPICDTARRSRQRVIIEDLATFPALVGTRDREVALGDGIRAAQSTPMISRKGEVVGVLSTQFPRPHRPGDDELRLIDLLAWTAADFVERHHGDMALRASEDRQSFLLRLSDALRPLSDAGQMQAEVTRVLGEWLGVDRAIYIDINDVSEGYAVEREYHVPSTRSVVGHYKYDRVNPVLLDGLRAGRTMVVADIEAAPLLSPGKRASYRDIGTAAFVTVPLVKDGRLVSLLSVQAPTARNWTPAEVSLIEEAAERTWAAVARAQSEQALRESEEHYRTLFATIDEGFVAGEVVEDDTGRVVDYRILEINPAFQQMNGAASDQILGKRVREVLPNVDPFWFEAINTVITTREDFRVERRVPEVGKWFECYFAPAGGADRRRFVAVVTDITRRKQIEEERERALRQAQEAVRVRDEFLSIASHELRNPIAAIKATSQLMRRLHERGRLDEQRLEKYIGTIDATSQRLSALVDDLLDVSRLRSGGVPVRPDATDMAALVRHAVEVERIASAGNRLRLAIENGPPLLLDSDRIEQVVVNLLDNAIKYSPTGGEVRILLTHDETGAHLRVQDQGIGLPVESLESIFQPFGRAANATSSQIQGMGLGLYIARRIAEAHGGKLWAESDGEGRGTTMHLWLPKWSGEPSELSTSGADHR